MFSWAIRLKYCLFHDTIDEKLTKFLGQKNNCVVIFHEKTSYSVSLPYIFRHHTFLFIRGLHFIVLYYVYGSIVRSAFTTHLTLLLRACDAVFTRGFRAASGTGSRRRRRRLFNVSASGPRRRSRARVLRVLSSPLR